MLGWPRKLPLAFPLVHWVAVTGDFGNFSLFSASAVNNVWEFKSPNGKLFYYREWKMSLSTNGCWPQAFTHATSIIKDTLYDTALLDIGILYWAHGPNTKTDNLFTNMVKYLSNANLPSKSWEPVLCHIKMENPSTLLANGCTFCILCKLSIRQHSLYSLVHGFR